MKTYQPKAKEVKRAWCVLDAKGEILGRLATKIAIYLTGKHKATYSTHMDMGDFVVVINAEKIEVTGKKDQQKVYRTHSGYPSGFKEKSYRQVMEAHPERIIEHAVLGMLPNNRLRDPRMLRLKVVVGDKNPYEKIDYIYAVGRRESSSCRVRLYRGKGENTINGMPAFKYFEGAIAKKAINKPFGATETSDNYYFSARVIGGGKDAQLDSLVLAISRTLVKASVEKNRVPLKKLGLLTRDSRVRQRRMVGMGGKSRRKKQSPKR